MRHQARALENKEEEEEAAAEQEEHESLTAEIDSCIFIISRSRRRRIWKFDTRDREQQQQQPMVAEGGRNVATKGNTWSKGKEEIGELSGISIFDTQTNPSL